MKSVLLYTLASLQLIVGISAAVSGVLLIVQPSGELLSMPLGLLEGTSFSNFLLPGIVLFFLVGCVHLIACAASLRRFKVSALLGTAAGILLTSWIYIQVSLIGAQFILQHLYFAVGTLEIALAFLLREQ